jgi:hypothetical protein
MDNPGVGCPGDGCPTGTAARRDGVRESQRENDRLVQMCAVDFVSALVCANKAGKFT